MLCTIYVLFRKHKNIFISFFLFAPARYIVAQVIEIWFYGRPGGWINIKMSSYQYRKSHCGDKTILRPSYRHNGISYTGKTTYLYWIGAQSLFNLYSKLYNKVAVDLSDYRLHGENKCGHFRKLCTPLKMNSRRNWGSYGNASLNSRRNNLHTRPCKFTKAQCNGKGNIGSCLDFSKAFGTTL